MATKLIETRDNFLIEVEALPDDVQQISSRVAQHVQDTLDKTFDKIRPLLIQTCKPVIATWKELDDSNAKVEIDEATIEMGLSFEGEGNIYVTKFKSGANLSIQLTLKKKPVPVQSETVP